VLTSGTNEEIAVRVISFEKVVPLAFSVLGCFNGYVILEDLAFVLAIS